MKKMILAMLFALSIAINVQASTTPIAETQISVNASAEKAIVKLFAKEAKIKGSNLNKYLSDLRANPDYDGYTINDTITTSDIVRLESSGSAAGFYADYLIIVRAGYKSQTTAAGYLKVQVYGNYEDETAPVVVQITAPVKVTIE